MLGLLRHPCSLGLLLFIDISFHLEIGGGSQNLTVQLNSQLLPQPSLSYQIASERQRSLFQQDKEPLSTGVSSHLYEPKTFVLGFSKGGTVLNQLVTELSVSDVKSNTIEQHMRRKSSEEDGQIKSSSKESLLKSITEIHYVDVGLNSAGAYITDHNVIESISKHLTQGAPGIRFVLRGTPRQWCDRQRVLIRKEKDKLVSLLESAAQRSGGKLKVCENFYFGDRPPDLQMHFEIIENMDVR